MTQIKIEVPANDHIALSAMADALQRIASERAPQELTPFEIGHSSPKAKEGTILRALQDSQHTPEDSEATRLDGLYETVVKRCEEFEASIHHNESVDKTVGTLSDCEASIHHENTKHDEAFEEAVDSTLDADGIPHDKRIHSKGATRLADNTWRLRKRPADKTEEEWTAYIDSVKAELKAVQDIPSETTVTETVQLNEGVTTDDIVEALTGEPTLDEEVVADLTPPVIDEPATQLEGVTPNGDVAIEPPVTTGAPVAPVTPPTSLTPPVVEAPSNQPSVTTFQELMLYITGNAKKRGADNELIKSVLLEIGGKRENGDPAIPAIPILSTRADLIPKFVTALEAKLK